MELKTQQRTVLGKKVSSLRTQGIIPGEVFGHGKENMHVSVNEKEFIKLYRNAGTHTIITLDMNGKEKIPVLISDVIINHISQKIIAIDFHQVRMDEVIQTDVPIEFIGDAPALKLGFTVLKIHNELPIEALPSNIPHKITVDLSTLTDLDMSINIGALKIPKTIKILLPNDTVLVTVSEKTKIEEVAPAPVTAGEETPETKEKEEASEEITSKQEKE